MCCELLYRPSIAFRLAPSRSHCTNPEPRLGSKPRRLSVSPWIRPSAIAFIGAHDELSPAEGHVSIRDRRKLVPARRESVAQLGRRMRFEVDRRPAVDLPARSIEHR